MKSWINKRLSVQIPFYLILLVGMFGLGMYYFVQYNTDLRESSEKRIYDIYGKTLIRNLSSNVIFGLLSQDVEVLAPEVESLFKDKVISYVVIYDKDYKVMYDKYDQGLMAGDLDLPPPVREYGGEESLSQEIRAARNLLFLDFQMPVRTPGAESLGAVRVGISLEELSGQIGRARAVGYVAIGLMLTLALAIAMIIRRAVMPPINRLVQASIRMGEGDYSAQVEVSSENELGMLSRTFNEMAANIQDQTQRTEHMIENIAEAIMTLNETASHLITVTSQQASGATEQATVVEEVVTTTEEISRTAERIAETASSVNEAAQQTSEAANRGNEYMGSTVQGMEQVREQVDKATGQIMDLATQAQSIGGIIDIIEEISEQTNLLALNAAIEAAGAGEAGKRFSVVANEVRHLANRTLESTESVRKMVDAIQQSVNTMVMLSENQQKAVNSGMGSVQAMGEYFQHILEMVETTRRSSSEIGLITRQQSTATQQMVTSIREVEEVAKEVEKGVKEVETSMSDLKALAEKLQQVISEKDDEAGQTDFKSVQDDGNEEGEPEGEEEVVTL